MASLKMILICLSLEIYFSSTQRLNSTLPASVPSVVIRGTGSETCPVEEAIEEQNLTSSVSLILAIISLHVHVVVLESGVELPTLT